MRFECEKSNLEQELNRAKQINTSRGSYDIYSHILLKLEGSLLTLKSTDSNFSFETSLPVLGYEDNEVAVAGDKLLSLLLARNQKNVFFELKDNRLEIKTEKETSKANTSYLKCASPEELIFPATKTEESSSLTLSQKKLQDLIAQTNYAVSTDENRAMLTGVCVKIKDKVLNFVSTDGNRLALASEGNCEHEDLTYILPVKGLNFIKSLLSGEGEASISFSENRAFFHFDRYDISMGLIAGTFPAYESIIPEAQEYEIELPKPELLEAIKMSTIMTDQRSKRIFFEFKESSLMVSSEQSEDGFTESEIALPVSLPVEVKLAFNSDYLTSALRVVEGNSVLLSFKDEKTVVLLQPIDKSSLHLVMPMNLN